jgi:hypothetical protein
MEPPIGYGSTHRSIFPESQFGTVIGSIFLTGAGQGKSKTGSIPVLSSSGRDRGA